MTVSTLYSSIERALDHVENGILLIGVVLFAIINVLAAFQIFVRFVGGGFLGVSGVWTEEVARYLLVIMVFVGAPYAMRNGENISIRPLFRLVPATAQKVLITFSNVLIVVFSALVIYAVIEVIDRTINVTLATVNWLTVGYAHVVLGVAFALVIVFAVEETVDIWLSDEAPMAKQTDEADVVDDVGASPTDGGE